MRIVAQARAVITLAVAAALLTSHLGWASAGAARRTGPACAAVTYARGRNALAMLLAALRAVLEFTARTVVVLWALTVIPDALAHTIAFLATSAIHSAHNRARIKLTSVADVTIATPARAVVTAHATRLRGAVQGASRLSGAVITSEAGVAVTHTASATHAVSAAHGTVQGSWANLHSTRFAAIAGAA